ncbi:EamA family transporter RarD [Amphritea japonica]|uniref:Chloramphenicol-sensitive protein RarD n=1 Tax=Amphritea japonica ATCC BAA-1530 TaxID=1278309 RepID=A0A7R6PMT0_9GAMM|nr:EamA family transporter RarD [Amphritea japonica]BBB27185.1 chloramphenicol-sensitive protein RarD [Amphritea japonica ATCC BAA-1530]
MRTEAQEQHRGIIFALVAYGMWGLVPIYFKSVASVSPFEVVAHRIIWSVLFLALFVAASGKWQEFIHYLRQKKLLVGLIASATVISLNWLVFIWAVGQDRILEASLGYFINPLISLLLGMVFLGERLRKTQWIAISMAAAGVVYQLVLLGSLPWVALVLACSFGIYGLLRKRIDIDPFSGLLIETLLLSPFALAYLFWLKQHDQLAFLSASTETSWLLIAAGIVTSLPLIFFAAGARRLTLTLNGLLQYIAPSIAFFLAVAVYHEPLDSDRLVTFCLIWAGLIMFTAEGVWQGRRTALVKVNH